MRRGFKKYAIAWVILLALFNVIAFVVPARPGFEKYTTSFWIGYVFITICFIGNLICANTAFKAASADKLFYNLPLITISYTALIISFVFGGFCMTIPGIPNWVGIVVCAIALAFFAIAIVKASAVAEAVELVETKVKTQTSFIHNLTVEAENLIARTTSPEIRAACKRIYEAVRYSDPMSNDALSVIEAKITVKIDEFASAVGTDNLEKAEEIADEIVILVSDRNRRCKNQK